MSVMDAMWKNKFLKIAQEKKDRIERLYKTRTCFSRIYRFAPLLPIRNWI